MFFDVPQRTHERGDICETGLRFIVLIREDLKSVTICGSNAPINVKPQGGGGGGADPGEFDILIEASAKFPTLGHLQTVTFPHSQFSNNLLIKPKPSFQ